MLAVYSVVKNHSIKIIHLEIENFTTACLIMAIKRNNLPYPDSEILIFDNDKIRTIPLSMFNHIFSFIKNQKELSNG